MKERPIPFTAPMVQAILEGKKTQTRRIVKPIPPNTSEIWLPDRYNKEKYWAFWEQKNGKPTGRCGELFVCPYGDTGDRLWVRETFAKVYQSEPPFEEDDPFVWEYRADTGDKYPGGWDEDTADDPNCGRWKRSIFMPRAASRIILEITDIRVERLHDISEQDAIAEGIKKWDEFRYSSPRGMNLANEFSFDAQFYQIWESINGEGSWELNPWVWAIQFKVIKPAMAEEVR